MSERKASRDLFRTVDDRVVFEGDPDARFLLVRAGDVVPDEYNEPSSKAATKAVVEPVDDPAPKAAEKAVNKAVKSAPNKRK